MTVHESPEIHYDYKPLKTGDIQHSSIDAGVYLVPNNKQYKKLMARQMQFLVGIMFLVCMCVSSIHRFIIDPELSYTVCDAS